MSGNLVHKVGVIFHAQDRLSSHMDKIGNKFTGLEAKQKAFERAQKAGTQSARQLEMAEDRVARAMQRQLGLNAQLMSSLNARKNAARAYDEDRIRAAKIYEDTQIAIEKRLTDLAKVQETERTRIHNAAIAERDRAAKRLASVQSKLPGLREAAAGQGFFSLDVARTAARDIAIDRAQRNASRNRISNLERNKDAQLQLAIGGFRQQNPNASETDLNLFRSAASASLEKEIAGERTVLQQLQNKIALLNRVVATTNEQTLAQKAFNEAQQNQLTCLAEIKVQQDAMHKATQDNNLIEMQQAKTAYDAKLIQLEEIKAQEEELAVARKIALDGQVAATATLLTENTELVGVLARQVELEEAALVKQRERVANLAKLHNVGSWAANSAGAVVGGAMGVGALAYAGNHVVEKYGEYQSAQNRLVNSASEINPATGKPWSTTIQNAITANHGSVMTSAGPLKLTSADQLAVVADARSAGLKSNEALDLLPTLTKMLYLGAGATGSRAATTEKNALALARIMEQFGISSAAAARPFMDNVNKSILTSNFMSYAALQGETARSAPLMRGSHIDMANSMPMLDFALGIAGGKPYTADTMLYNAINVLQQGGTSAASRQVQQLMYDNGLFHRGKPVPLLNHGRPVFDAHHKQRFIPGPINFDHADGTPRNASEVLLGFNKAVYQLSGYKGNPANATPQQTSAATAFMHEAVSSMRGARLLQDLLQPNNLQRLQLLTGRNKTAPGVDATLKSGVDLYARHVFELNQTMTQATVNVGKAWKPTMDSMVVSAQKAADALSNFAEQHPKRTALGLQLGIGGIITAVLGKVTGLGGVLKNAAVNGYLNLAPGAKALAGRGLTAAVSAGKGALNFLGEGASATGGVVKGMLFLLGDIIKATFQAVAKGLPSMLTALEGAVVPLVGAAIGTALTELVYQGLNNAMLAVLHPNRVLQNAHGGGLFGGALGFHIPGMPGSPSALGGTRQGGDQQLYPNAYPNQSSGAHGTTTVIVEHRIHLTGVSPTGDKQLNELGDKLVSGLNKVIGGMGAYTSAPSLRAIPNYR